MVVIGGEWLRTPEKSTTFLRVKTISGDLEPNKGTVEMGPDNERLSMFGTGPLQI